MRAVVSFAVLSAGLALGGCGEKPQTASARKADAPPSQGAAAAYTAPGWKQGDAASWEAHLKARSQAQNEYTRTQRN